MIHHVDGVLVEKAAGRLVVEVGGVGLELLVSDDTAKEYDLPGGRVRLLTHLAVREDNWTLFGFANTEERSLFRLLLGVQGVGPKLALGILSGKSPARLRDAVAAADVASLTTISGVGKKTAQRIVVDLRDKVGALPGSDEVPGGEQAVPSAERDDAVDALIALGYSRTIARDAVQGARAAGVGEAENASLEVLVKKALRRL